MRPLIALLLLSLGLAATPRPVAAQTPTVLRERDHARASVVLRFQLIRATDTLVHDPALAEVDSTLRSLLRFKGYRLAGEALTVVDERENFRAGLPGRMSVDGDISSIDGVDGRVRMKVSLSGDARMIVNGSSGRDVLISTGLTVPLGHTVVLGTSNAEGSTYVLTVRPERTGKGRP